MLSALTLDQLRVLVTVQETGSFSAAGRKLRRVQSAISHAIKALEDTHQVTLFDRSGRTPKLTDAGRALAGQARQVVQQADLFVRTADAIAAGLEPELTLAIDGMVPAGPVMRSLAGLQAEFPELSVTVFTEGLSGGERRVRDGSVVLAFCVLLPAAAQDLQAYPLMSMNLVPVVAAEHKLARETRPLSREVLAEHVQLVLTNPHNPDGPSYSVVSSRVWRFVDLPRRMEFLLAGFGWGSLPLHLAEPHLRSGRLIRLATDDPGVVPAPIPVCAVHARTRPLGRGARWLLDDLRQQAWP